MTSFKTLPEFARSMCLGSKSSLPQVLIQNEGIPNFQPRKTLLSLAKAMFLLFRCPSLPGSVYIPTCFPDLRLCSAVLCEFGTDRAGNMKALLRKTTPEQVLNVLVRRKIGGVPCLEDR